MIVDLQSLNVVNGKLFILGYVKSGHVSGTCMYGSMSKYLTKSNKIKTILACCGKSYIRQGGELLSPDLGNELLYSASFLRKTQQIATALRGTAWTL